MTVNPFLYNTRSRQTDGYTKIFTDSDILLQVTGVSASTVATLNCNSFTKEYQVHCSLYSHLIARHSW